MFDHLCQSDKLIHGMVEAHLIFDVPALSPREIERIKNLMGTQVIQGSDITNAMELWNQGLEAWSLLGAQS